MNRGEIVEVSWPYSDLSGTKVRPAVVVQADFLNSLIDDTIFVKITTKQFGIPGTEVALDPAQETNSGLTKLCYASCNNLLTRDQAIAGPIVGFLSDAVMQQIEACLKIVLQIP
ncbi:MAG TPA: type II toxin-antitoxin system PemK/MazF family toxin [Gemmataceae bacterium]|jgi:mRNA interferase MazF|nr:type II toxin-antitoxin system PemK/MazF family toxin [Gemmataceae bacterium]